MSVPAATDETTAGRGGERPSGDRRDDREDRSTEEVSVTATTDEASFHDDDTINDVAFYEDPCCHPGKTLAENYECLVKSSRNK